MAGSDSSVRGGHHGEQEPPIARAELHQLQNSLLEAMERMFNERLPAAGGRGPHREESGDENSGFGNRFHDRFGNGHGGRGGGRRADFHQQGGGRHADFCDQRGGGHGRDHHVHFDDENSGFGDGFHDDFRGHGGGRHAGHNDRRAGGERRHGRRVHFDDEEEIHSESKNRQYDDNDNPFADHGRFGQHRDRRRGAGHDGGHHRGRHNRDDPDSIARVKLSVPKFSGREDADAYLEWEEQCD